MHRRTNRFVFIVLLVSCISSPAVLFGQGSPVKIADIKPVILNQNIRLEFTLVPFFSEKITGTIQSGLPTLLEIETIVFDQKHQELSRHLFARRISYNMWEERYRIDEPDSTLFFSSFEKFKKACLQLRSTPIFKVITIQGQRRIFVRARAGIRLMSDNQNQQLTGWLNRSYQTQQAYSTDEKSSGFRLSFGALVSFFMGDSQNNADKSAWHQFELNLVGIEE